MMPDEIHRSARLQARITPEALSMLQRAAALEGRSVSDFVVEAAQKAARRTIEEAEIIRLSAEDQRRFADALLNPPKPSAALLRAFEHHRRLLGSE